MKRFLGILTAMGALTLVLAARFPDMQQLAYPSNRTGNNEIFLINTDGSAANASAFSFNATTPERVQIGGVWTPPEWRGRGYARAVVAGALLDGKAEGATRGVLFTDIANLSAQRAYYALGFEVIGDYGIILFA